MVLVYQVLMIVVPLMLAVTTDAYSVAIMLHIQQIYNSKL